MLKALIDLKEENLNEKWIKYLCKTSNKNVNYERVDSLKKITNRNTYNYVMNTLNILDREKEKYKDIVIYYVEEVLKWSEVSKCGTKKDIETWKNNNFNLYVHNIGSSEIYVMDNKDYNNIIRVLIKTHGLIGQYLRGEITFSENKELYELILNKEIDKEELKDILILLNKCVVEAVSPSLYQKLEKKIYDSIIKIVNGEFTNEMNITSRLSALNSGLSDSEKDKLKDILKNKLIKERLEDIFKRLEFWFYEAALSDFNIEEQIKILLIIYNNINEKTKYITFEKIMKMIYFDFNGKREINIYKKRIIENYIFSLEYDNILNNNITNNPHISLNIQIKNETILPVFKFSKAAGKLIEFCEVAYISDSMYNKAVFMLYDLFGFRRDNYDRFYNEINYLNTMNKSINHKAIILDYIVGNDILDVGPGGGALMDLILSSNNNLNVMGIDISTNVIDALNKKKKEENKKWNVIKGDALNLDDYFKKESLDTIIYSSIIHELFSYINYNGKKFNHEVIIKTLKSAYNSLRDKGRIIIRDGIKTEPENTYRIIEFKNIKDLEILGRYCHDFKGRKITYEKIDNNKVKMLVNDAMEFLYTYTWGEDSYALEVQEQFGYYTPSEYVKVIADNLKGANIITCNAFLQEGYEENLLNKISIYDENMNVVKLPNSTCIIVIEKNKEVK